MSFIDRLSGVSAESLPDRAHFGRWLLCVSDGEVRVNGLSVDDGDVLAPGATGGWSLARSDGTTRLAGRFFTDALPDEQDAEALLGLGRLLRGADRAEGGWRDWCGISPLARGLDKAVQPHPLEDHIEDEFEHLAAVCRHPRTRIRRETERVLVARARRVARDAPVYLASHTEDWEHRTITGIQPRRILADVREERWDLYENRVTVGLVDDLVAWLRRRIAEVRRIRHDVYDRMEEIRGSPSGTRHRADRIYRLWGQAWDDNAGEVAKDTLKRLDSLLYRLLGLMDSRLYKHIPARSRASGGLRVTNLFSNDDHYRGVARLWHEWSRLAVPPTRSSADVWARYQDIHRGLDAWCMLLIVRACSQLRLDPVEDSDRESEIRPGASIRLAQGFGIKWDRTGFITVMDADGDRALLRFVPLIHGLENARTPEALAARVDPLVDAVSGSDHWTVILHLAAPGDPPHAALAGVGNPPLPGTRGAIDFIRVSPFSLDSVERVSRAIGWATLVPRMLAYPPVVHAVPALRTVPDLQAALDAEIGGGTLRTERPNTLNLVVLRQPSERSLHIVAKCLMDARARLDPLKEESQAVQEGLRRSRGDRRRTADLNREKRRLLVPLREAESRVQSLSALDRDIRKACHDLAELATCPACRESDVAFEAREDDCFAATCRAEGCEALWELHSDRTATVRTSGADRESSERRIPVMLPGDADPEEWLDDDGPQWVDDILGCDVLAIPRLREGDGIKFHPPRTVPRSG